MFATNYFQITIETYTNIRVTSVATEPNCSAVSWLPRANNLAPWQGRNDVMSCAHTITSLLSDAAELQRSFNAERPHPSQISIVHVIGRFCFLTACFLMEDLSNIKLHVFPQFL